MDSIHTNSTPKTNTGMSLCLWLDKCTHWFECWCSSLSPLRSQYMYEHERVGPTPFTSCICIYRLMPSSIWIFFHSKHGKWLGNQASFVCYRVCQSKGWHHRSVLSEFVVVPCRHFSFLTFIWFRSSCSVPCLAFYFNVGIVSMHLVFLTNKDIQVSVFIFFNVSCFIS